MDESPIQYAVTTPTIANNVIAANGAGVGGGIMLLDTDPGHGGIPVVTNNTVVANNGPGIVWHTTSPAIRNNLIAYNTWGLELGDTNPPSATIGNNCVYGNTLRGQRSDYQGIADQTGLNRNISANPIMANYKIGNFHLQPSSPCIDAGTAVAVEPGWIDIDGQPRTILEAESISGPMSRMVQHGIPSLRLYMSKQEETMRITGSAGKPPREPLSQAS